MVTDILTVTEMENMSNNISLSCGDITVKVSANVVKDADVIHIAGVGEWYKDGDNYTTDSTKKIARPHTIIIDLNSTKSHTLADLELVAKGYSSVSTSDTNKPTEDKPVQTTVAPPQDISIL